MRELERFSIHLHDPFVPNVVEGRSFRHLGSVSRPCSTRTGQVRIESIGMLYPASASTFRKAAP